MATLSRDQVHVNARGMPEPRDIVRQAAWFIAVSILAFVVPYIGTSALDVHHDLFYLAYFACVLAAVGIYATMNGIQLNAFFEQNWKLSVVLGALVSVFLVWNVLTREDATPRPDGLYFAFEFAWRGVAYGVVDAILLSAFPAMVAFALMQQDVRGLGRRIVFGALTLVMTLIITATYHLGYDHYRDEGVRAPELGNVVISVPAIVSVSPIGSLGAHVVLHTTAVTHSYETETFLPPQTDAD
jgi:hypothetical protein